MKGVEVLRSIRFDRLKGLTNLDRRSTIAATAACASVLLIVGGVAFASEGNDGPKPINQAASLFHSASPSSPKTNSAQPDVTSDSTPAAANQPVQPAPSLPTPTTIIGPNGESIVVPPLATTPTVKPPANTPTTTPSAGNTNPAISSPTVPAATTPTTSTPLSSAPTTTVRPASTPTNGTASPKAIVGATSTSEDPTVNLNVTASDADGFVRRMNIDWGDGTTQQIFAYDLTACIDLANTSHSEAPTHTYAAAGTYTIGVTVTSTNCLGDASQNQQAIGATTVVTGGTITTVPVIG